MFVFIYCYDLKITSPKSYYLVNFGLSFSEFYSSFNTRSAIYLHSAEVTFLDVTRCIKTSIHSSLVRRIGQLICCIWLETTQNLIRRFQQGSQVMRRPLILRIVSSQLDFTSIWQILSHQRNYLWSTPFSTWIRESHLRI